MGPVERGSAASLLAASGSYSQAIIYFRICGAGRADIYAL